MMTVPEIDQSCATASASAQLADEPQHGQRHETILSAQQILHVGDHIVSDNGLFIAILQRDGSFCVFRGLDIGQAEGQLWHTGKPGDDGDYFALLQTDGNFCIYRGTGLHDNQGWHWGTQTTAEGAAFYAVLQDDGNFCIRKGSGLGDSAGLLWASGITDRVDRIEEVLHIEYDLAAAYVLRTSPASLYSETLSNRNPQTEISTVSGSVTVTETSAWTDTLALRAGNGGAGFSPNLPVMAGGRVVLATASVSYVRNGANTGNQHWGFATPVTVPPYATRRVVVSATYSTISVPYILIGRLRFESGAEVIGTVRGVYMGSNAHDLMASYGPPDALGGGQRVTRILTPIIGPQTGR